MMEILNLFINGVLFSIFATKLAMPPPPKKNPSKYQHPPAQHNQEMQGQQRSLWPCWPTDILIITFLLYCQACNQRIPRPAFALCLYLY